MNVTLPDFYYFTGRVESFDLELVTQVFCSNASAL